MVKIWIQNLNIDRRFLLDTWNRRLYIAAVDSQLFAEIEMYQVSDLQPG
jgi:hypothetical protein